MAKRVKNKKSIKNETIKNMQKLGVYKPEFDPIIDHYAEMNEHYLIINEKFKNSSYEFQTTTADGGKKKAPIVATLETLRKDILAYSDRLCLNPKSLDSITIEKTNKPSKFETWMNDNG